MPKKDQLDLGQQNFLDFLVDRRKWLVGAVICISAVMVVLLPNVKTDPSLKSGVDSTGKAYREYQRFIDAFGNEEFILLALRSERGARDPRLLSALDTLSNKLRQNSKIAEVISLSTLRVLGKRNGLLGTYPVLQTVNGARTLPEHTELERVKKALPIMDYLISSDLRTVGILIRIKEKWKFDFDTTKALRSNIEKLVKEAAPPGTAHRMIGPQLIRQAIVRYSIDTGIVFGVLCMLIGTFVSAYIFKSAKLTAVTNLILGVCVLWIVGLMSALGIPLNSTTALSFGFIPITTLEMVIHMFVRYGQFYGSAKDRTAAVKLAVRWLARPFLICSGTTAVGFGSLMISSIPMVRQLGFIMGVGILISYCLAMILGPAIFMNMKSLNALVTSRTSRDTLDRVLGTFQRFIFGHHVRFVGIGAVVTLLLLAGAPMIRSDTQLLRMLSPATSEVQDIMFVQNNLTSVSSLEIMLETRPNGFKEAALWKKVAELEKRLKDVPDVVGMDSFLPMLEYSRDVLDPGRHSDTDLFSNPKLIPELLTMLAMNTDGRRLTRRFLDQGLDRMRISVRIKNSPGIPIGDTMERLSETAVKAMNGTARAVVTGDLAVFAVQTSALIQDQIKSMILAAPIITVLMMIQMQSVVLGLISLIPNVPPVAAVFGIMGWFGIPLDGVTVFAATVAVGLAVDNTIHYLTQLKREVRVNPEQGIEPCVATAYVLTARQMASWSVVTLLGFLALVVSPFRPVVLFGMLGCSALMLGLYGDLFFLQSLLLSFPRIRRTIRRLIERESTGIN